jgi:hypothetical protein
MKKIQSNPKCFCREKKLNWRLIARIATMPDSMNSGQWKCGMTNPLTIYDQKIVDDYKAFRIARARIFIRLQDWMKFSKKTKVALAKLFAGDGSKLK